MQVLVLGAGIIGVSTAWHLLELGHEVTVVERQAQAAMETSFANAGQISVSYCEPWANKNAPYKIVEWMLRRDAPLLLRLQNDPHQWRWCWQFLKQCNDDAFERNVRQLVALGSYSHAAHKALIAATGIEFHRQERGIAHYFTDPRAFDAAHDAVQLMQRFGVERKLLNRKELLQIEPALTPFAQHLEGGTYTASDESGDAFLLTQALAKHCEQRGAQFLYYHDVLSLNVGGGAIESVAAKDRLAGPEGLKTLYADAVVVACGSYSAPLLRSAGVNLPIYPGKGYSATFKILQPEKAPQVSLLDDTVKCGFTRLGDQLRVAGTIELGGFDLSLTSPTAQARCLMLAKRTEEVLPGVCDTRTKEQGGEPHFWCGLRPSTPTNVPYIGKTGIKKLWVNAGHGTLGWTHGAGSGKALAELISGEKPQTSFEFYRVTF